jgi:pimeloyl-ACP methyl ester carboxylesterase
VPFAHCEGHRIHYTIAGQGPPVVLLHGGFSRGRVWERAGYVDQLADVFTVLCPDSLGFGDSDKPVDVEAYVAAARAEHVVTVVDHAGFDRAHVAGYSMGGWTAAAVAAHRPECLRSLAIGGWDVVGGLETARVHYQLDAVGFDFELDILRSAVPDLVAWITPELEPAVRAATDAVHDVAGHADAVGSLTVPVLLWSGERDVYHPAMAAFAGAHGRRLVTVPGDHPSAMEGAAAEVVAALRSFFLAA